MKKTFRISDEAQKALTTIQEENNLKSENAVIELILTNYGLRTRRIETLDTHWKEAVLERDKYKAAVHQFRTAFKRLNEMPSI